MKRLLALLLLLSAPAFAQSPPHLNPLIGDVWTYFGPTLGGGWGLPASGGGGGPGGNPGGATGAIQFNNSGSFGGTVITGLVLGTGSGAPASYTGATCTNQFIQILSPNGVPTCSTVVTSFIANAAVTYGKIQNEAASTLLGNPTVSPASPGEITLGTNLSFSGSVLNATGSVAFANPTATIGTAPVNGVATTAMRSDAAPQIPQCSASTFGACKVDGTTITAVGGVISGSNPVNVTAAAPSVVINPTPGTGTFTVGLTVPINDISGAGTAIASADNTKLDKLGTFTYTLAQAGASGFAAGWSVCLLNTSGGNATITTTTSVFIGAGGTSTLVLVPGAWACPTSDGSNWQTFEAGNNIAGTNVTITQNANGTRTFAANLTQSREEAIGWLATVNPNNATVFTAKAASTVTSIVGRVETATGAAATITVNKAASGTACSAGTALHSGTFNANGTAATNQTLTLTTTALAAGDSVCLQTTGTTSWTGGTGIGGLTVSITTP